MVLNEGKSCLSSRMVTLLFLYYQLFHCVWSSVCNLIDFGDPMYHWFLYENPHILYMTFGIASFASFIYLTTIIFTIKKKASFSLFFWVITSVIFNLLLRIYTIYTYITTGAAEESYKMVVEKEARKLPTDELEEFRRTQKGRYLMIFRLVYVTELAILFIGFFSIFVFYRYTSQLKENPTGSRVVGERVQSEEADSPCPSAPLPEYSTQTPRYVVEYLQMVSQHTSSGDIFYSDS